MLAGAEIGLAEFLEAAKEVYAQKADDPEFAFVATRLWMADLGSPPNHWAKTFRDRYNSFVSEFDWHTPGAPGWVKADLLKRTLSVFQKRTPELLTARSALRMIVNVGRLGELLRGAA